MKIYKRSNYTYNDLDNLEKNGGRVESFGNAHYFISDFYNSSTQNRILRNPHGIKYDTMFNVFGEPNFQDDYNEDDWWILEYDDSLFTVHIGSHGEGSMISKFFDSVKRVTYNKQFSIDAENFHKQLFIQLGI